MTRPPRNFTTDHRFHVINHGVDGQDLFSVEDDWLLFESLIGRACEDYSFRLNAYALMSNHYHFLADLSDCDDRVAVSAAFGVLQSTYASYFNDRTGRRGPLFEPRFLAFGVDGDLRTHRAARYIHRNPIDICGPGALGAYRWSSLPVALGRRESPDWLDCTLFTPNRPAAYLADLTGCSVDDLRPLDSLPPQRRTSLDAIDAAVSSLPASTVDVRDRRSIVAALALDLRAADVLDVATRLSLSPGRVRELAGQVRTRRRDDPAFDALLERVEYRLAHA